MRKLLYIALILGALTATAYSADSLTIVCTGGIRGRTTGCGCESVSSGGIQRRATVIEQNLHGSVRLPFGVDAGRFLDLDPDVGRGRSRCALLGLARLGLAVVAVTPRDMFYGAPFLRQTADDADISLLSANLCDTTGKPLFRKWKEVTAYTDAGVKVKVAVTSLSTYQEGQKFNSAGSSWTVDDPVTLLSDLSAGRPSADLTILLCDLSEQELRALFSDNSMFDVIVSSSRQLLTPTPFPVGNAIVAAPSIDGRTVDGFRIEWGRGAVPVAQRCEWFIYSLTGQVAEDPEMLRFLNHCEGAR